MELGSLLEVLVSERITITAMDGEVLLKWDTDYDLNSLSNSFKWSKVAKVEIPNPYTVEIILAEKEGE